MCKPEVFSPEAVNALSDDAIAAKLKCRALPGQRLSKTGGESP